MRREMEGVEKLRQTLELVAEGLPPGEAPRLRSRAAPTAARGWKLAAAMAIVAAALLLYPAGLSFHRWISPQPPSAAPSGPVRLEVLTLPRPPEELRGAGGSPLPRRLTFEPSSPLVVLLEIDPSYLRDSRETYSETPSETRGETFRIELASTDGASVQSWELSEVDLRPILARSGGLPFLLSSDSLRPGTYHLRLLRSGRRGDEVLSDLILERVERPSPEDGSPRRPP